MLRVKEKRDYLSRMEVGAEIPTVNLQNTKQNYWATVPWCSTKRLQGCTNPGLQGARAFIFLRVAPKFSGSSELNLFHVILLACTVKKWLLDFGKFTQSWTNGYTCLELKKNCACNSWYCVLRTERWPVVISWVCQWMNWVSISRNRRSGMNFWQK
jgi:hypothetical protein